MTLPTTIRQSGFTLIEVLIALLILATIALMSYSGLSTVLDTRQQVTEETEKWRHLTAFFARFEQDITHAAPYAVRTASGRAAAWRGQTTNMSEPHLTFSRFATAEGVDNPRRVAYRLNEQQEIELWLWSGLDVTPDVTPIRYTVLRKVVEFNVQYMTSDFRWVDSWPITNAKADDTSFPRAVQLHITLISGEKIVRIFSI